MDCRAKPGNDEDGSAVKPAMTDAVSAALRLRLRRRRLAYAVEGRRFRLLRQSQPAQPQIAALGRELRRTRQFRPPRALGSLGPAIHHIGRHHTRSRTMHTAGGAAASPLRERARRPQPWQVFLPGHAQTRGQPAPMQIRWRTVALQPHIRGRVSSERAPIYVILPFSTPICRAWPCAGHSRLVFFMR
jgi:hypothetical protein